MFKLIILNLSLASTKWIFSKLDFLPNNLSWNSQNSFCPSLINKFLKLSSNWETFVFVPFIGFFNPDIKVSLIGFLLKSWLPGTIKTLSFEIFKLCISFVKNTSTPSNVEPNLKSKSPVTTKKSILPLNSSNLKKSWSLNQSVS